MSVICITVRAVEFHWRRAFGATAQSAGDPMLQKNYLVSGAETDDQNETVSRRTRIRNKIVTPSLTKKVTIGKYFEGR